MITVRGTNVTTTLARCSSTERFNCTKGITSKPGRSDATWYYDWWCKNIWFICKVYSTWNFYLLLHDVSYLLFKLINSAPLGAFYYIPPYSWNTYYTNLGASSHDSSRWIFLPSIKAHPYMIRPSGSILYPPLRIHPLSAPPDLWYNLIRTRATNSTHYH